jgi:hypothetical protein
MTYQDRECCMAMMRRRCTRLAIVGQCKEPGASCWKVKERCKIGKGQERQANTRERREGKSGRCGICVKRIWKHFIPLNPSGQIGFVSGVSTAQVG